MSSSKNTIPCKYEYEHDENVRSRLGVLIKLDDFEDAAEYVATGEHSVEKYLQRLEARKKSQAENNAL